jgi:nitrite reductase (NADH) small subunit
MSVLTTWIDVCQLSDIPKNSGVCADLNGKQVALFHLNSKKLQQASEVKAVGNYDPFGRANVLSRGLITENDDNYYVASPLLKQQFCLTTGQCEQDELVTIPTYQARILDGLVQLREA